MSEDFRASQIQTNQIISSGSNGTGAKIVFYDIAGQSAVAPNQGIIDPDKFNTGSIGQDIFLFVSGGIGGKNYNSQSIATFGGDVHISGNLTVDGDLDGNKAFRLSVADYVSTTNTSSNPSPAGQVIFNGTEFSGSLTLRAILSSGDPSGTATIKLFEITTGSYVEIGGPTITTLSVVGTSSTVVESVNLYEAAGFVTGGLAQYELQLYTETSGVAAFVGGAELRPEGTFLGKTIVTESFVTQFVSGTTGFRLGFNDFVSTTNTSSNPELCGQVIFPANEFSGSLTFRAVLSTANPTQTASVRLFNATSGAYVELLPGQDALYTSNLDPTIVESQDLYGAVNFNTSSVAVYEMHLHTSNGAVSALAGGGELRPQGSFTGYTVQNNNYISGTWVDDNQRLKTTASVAISSENIFADEIGQDVYFYVSGTLSSGSNVDKVSVFGGSVRVSGNLIAENGFSGSLTRLSNGESYMVAGPNISITTSSNGQVTIGVTGSVSAAPTRLCLGSHYTTTATSSSPQAVGGGYFVPSEHNTTSCEFRAIVNTTTGSNLAFVQLYNITSGALVHIGGVGITELSSSNTTPTLLQSVNLFSAINFSSAPAIYEVRVYGSGATSPITTLLNSEMVCV